MPKPHSKPITLNSWGWVPGIGIFLSFWFHNAAKVGNHWTKGMLGILSWDTGSICWLQMIHYNKIQGWRSLQIIVLIVHGSWEMPLCVTHLSAPIMQAQRMGKREREIYSYDQQLCLTPWAPQTWGKQNIHATDRYPFSVIIYHGMPSGAVWKEASLENWMGNAVHPSFLHRKWRPGKMIWFTQR